MKKGFMRVRKNSSREHYWERKNFWLLHLFISLKRETIRLAKLIKWTDNDLDSLLGACILQVKWTNHRSFRLLL